MDQYSAPLFLIPLAFMGLYVFVACCFRLLGKLSDRAWQAQCERHRLDENRRSYLERVRAQNDQKTSSGPAGH